MPMDSHRPCLMGAPMPHAPGGQRLRQIVASVPLSKFWTTPGKSASEIRTGTAARSAPVGRETRGTARRWGRETRPPRRGVTNRYPAHSMLPNSSATGNAILFLVANVFGRGFPNVWGLCTPHTWGHPNTMQLFLLIYIRLFTHCNFAVSSGIFRYSRHFCSDVNSGYHCKNIRNVL